MSATTFVALSLGGNLGDVARAFDKAIDGLRQAGLADIKRSSIGRYPPVDCHPGTPDFLNMAIAGKWPGSLEKLRDVCVKLENAAGRPEKHDPAASRTLDVDIIIFGDAPISSGPLLVPHPKATRRAFVMEPLAEIVGDLTFPGTQDKISELACEASTRNPRRRKTRH